MLTREGWDKRNFSSLRKLPVPNQSNCGLSDCLPDAVCLQRPGRRLWPLLRLLEVPEERRVIRYALTTLAGPIASCSFRACTTIRQHPDILRQNPAELVEIRCKISALLIVIFHQDERKTAACLSEGASNTISGEKTEVVLG